MREILVLQGQDKPSFGTDNMSFEKIPLFKDQEDSIAIECGDRYIMQNSRFISNE